MPTYEAVHFSLAAPCANVTLRHPDTGARVTGVLMLLDTGADTTLLPRRAVESIGIVGESDKAYELVAFDGTTSVTSVVRLELLLLARTFKGQFALSDAEYGVIGRNVLNHLILRFDGPQLQWDET